MAPKKKSKKQPAKKQPKKVVDPNIEDVYETEVSFMCPKRGLVKQKVKVKKYKTRCTDTLDVIGTETDSDLLDKIEKEDDGLSIYSEEELSKED